MVPESHGTGRGSTPACGAGGVEHSAGIIGRGLPIAVGILVDAPWMTAEQMNAVLGSIAPPFPFPAHIQ